MSPARGKHGTLDIGDGSTGGSAADCSPERRTPSDPSIASPHHSENTNEGSLPMQLLSGAGCDAALR